MRITETNLELIIQKEMEDIANLYKPLDIAIVQLDVMLAFFISRGS